jgi:hypothetical protein
MHTFRDRVHACTLQAESVHGRARRRARVCTPARPEKLTPTDCCLACKTVQTRPLQRLPQGTLREKH